MEESTGLLKPGYKKTTLHTLAALIPMFILATAFALNEIYPFGNRQSLVVDYWHQYYPFLSDLWHKLREGNSLLWSWTAGGGSDYLAQIGYYMASPLNLLIALFPHENLREVLDVILIVRIGIAGLFMSLYLQYNAKRYDLLLPVFSSLYALCAFTLGYYWNIMWFDTFALMPLVILGVQKLIDEDGYKLYIPALAAAIICNFYMGVFVCIFVFIYFFIQCFASRPGKREFFQKLGSIALYTVIAVGLTAFLTLPVYSALQRTYNSVYSMNTFPATTRFYASYIDVLGNFIAFTPPTGMEGLPNLYSGMICIILLPVFLISNRVKPGEKIAYMLATVFLVVSTNINVLDYILHGFSYTHSLPLRFTFLITFLLVVMAYRAFTLIDEFGIKHIIAVTAAAAVFITMAFLGPQENKHAVWNIVMCVFYIGSLILIKHSRKLNSRRAVKVLIAALILTELSFTVFAGVEKTGSTDRVSYPYRYKQVSQLLELRQETDNDFYRTEFTARSSFNTSSLYHFDGLSLFSSLTDTYSDSFIRGIGLQGRGRGNRFTYAETTPLTNAFLNMRYLISREGTPADDSDFWDRIAEIDGAVLLENNKYLPLGFMVGAETAEYTGDIGDPFNAQNDLFRRATGLYGDLFSFVPLHHTDHTDYETVEFGLNEWSFTLEAGKEEGKFRFSYEIPSTGSYYIYWRISGGDRVNIEIGDDHFRQVEADHRSPYIFRAGHFRQGDKITLVADSTEKRGTAQICVGLLNRDLFEWGYELLSDEILELTHFSDTRIAGKITVREEGLLYTSIPHAGLWRAYVNDTEADIITIDGAMAAVLLDEGEFTVEFRFHNRSFTAGIILSSASLAAFLALVLIYSRKKRVPVTEDAQETLVSIEKT